MRRATLLQDRIPNLRLEEGSTYSRDPIVRTLRCVRTMLLKGMMMGTFAVIGLGNPGEEYEHTRHNAGFDTLDAIADDLGARYWKNECGALCAHVQWHGNDLILAKPQSFMNRSGGPVSQIMKKYDVDLDHILIIHDELDIPSGTIKVKFGGGLAGHNGLKSIADKVQSRDWLRFRIGIGRPPGRMDVVDYVLRAPKGEQLEEFESAQRRGADAVLYYLENGLAKTQGEFN